MRFLIMGCCGMTGHIMSQYLIEGNHDVIGFARRESSICKTYIGDAMDFQNIRHLIENGNFDIVVNCCGVLNNSVDANPYSGIMINSALPHFISDCCNKCGIKFIHLSTDCVFSGNRGGYIETDLPDAASLYGRTKMLGEMNNNSLCIRTSLIAPDTNEKGIGLFNWFMKQTRINGYSNVVWSGVSAIELTRFAVYAAKNNISGICHLTNNKQINKYNLLKLFNKYKRTNKAIIEEDPEPKSNKSLLNTRSDYSYNIPTYEKMVEEIYEWVYAHPNLYLHYSLM